MLDRCWRADGTVMGSEQLIGAELFQGECSSSRNGRIVRLVDIFILDTTDLLNRPILTAWTCISTTLR